MKLWSLTVEYVEHLKKKLAEKRQELDIMIERTPQDLWEEDLDLFMELWNIFEQDMEDFENNIEKKREKRTPRCPRYALL